MLRAAHAPERNSTTCVREFDERVPQKREFSHRHDRFTSKIPNRCGIFGAPALLARPTHIAPRP